MYELIKSHNAGNNTELRLGKTPQGYVIGLWDSEAEKYVGNLTIFKYTLENAEEKAIAYFEEQK